MVVQLESFCYIAVLDKEILCNSFLYILAMEDLYVLIKDVVASSLIFRVKVGRNEFQLSHVLYVDYVVFITK